MKLCPAGIPKQFQVIYSFVKTLDELTSIINRELETSLLLPLQGIV
jgi:hypothetical protein